jgi:hypothetical protein
MRRHHRLQRRLVVVEGQADLGQASHGASIPRIPKRIAPR